MLKSRTSFSPPNYLRAIGSIVLLVVAGCNQFELANSGSPPGMHSIVCWGDSMTSGNEGIVDQGNYPSLLQAESGWTVVNGGVGGQTSSQIGVRQGGIPTFVTVPSRSIPAYGTSGVAITFATGYEPLTSPDGKVRGSILGVEGEVTLSGPLPSGTFTFTPVSPGSTSVSVSGTPQFVPDTPFATYLPIFWEGRNNIFQTAFGPWGPTQIESDIALQVQKTPKGKDYLVLSVLNENAPSERRGTQKLSVIIKLNNDLCSTYGSHYLDVRALLVSAYNPSLATDVSDNENDMPPTSLNAIIATGTLAQSIGGTDTSFSLNVTGGALCANQNLIVGNESIHVLSSWLWRPSLVPFCRGTVHRVRWNPPQ